MKGIAARVLAVFVAMGLLLGSAAPVLACGGGCCCKGETAASDSGQPAKISRAHCCGCNVSEASPLQSALPEFTFASDNQPVQAAAAAMASSLFPQPAGEKAVRFAPDQRARSNLPIYKLLSSYLC